MESQTAQQLIAGFSTFTTPGEVAASAAEDEGVSVTITITLPTTPTLPVTTFPVDHTFVVGC